MNLEELRCKIENNKVCRLCLSENCDNHLELDDSNGESRLKPEELIEKFKLVEVNFSSQNINENFKKCFHVCYSSSTNKYH